MTCVEQQPVCASCHFGGCSRGKMPGMAAAPCFGRHAVTRCAANALGRHARAVRFRALQAYKRAASCTKATNPPPASSGTASCTQAHPVRPPGTTTMPSSSTMCFYSSSSEFDAFLGRAPQLHRQHLSRLLLPAHALPPRPPSRSRPQAGRAAARHCRADASRTGRQGAGRRRPAAAVVALACVVPAFPNGLCLTDVFSDLSPRRRIMPAPCPTATAAALPPSTPTRRPRLWPLPTPSPPWAAAPPPPPPPCSAPGPHGSCRQLVSMCPLTLKMCCPRRPPPPPFTCLLLSAPAPARPPWPAAPCRAPPFPRQGPHPLPTLLRTCRLTAAPLSSRLPPLLLPALGARAPSPPSRLDRRRRPCPPRCHSTAWPCCTPASPCSAPANCPAAQSKAAAAPKRQSPCDCPLRC